MKDILIIAPYEELFEICKDVVAKRNLKNIDVVMADTDGNTNIEELILDKKPLVVISRGGVYSAVKNMFASIAVVEMRIGAYDIINSLKDIFESDETVAVLGSENIIYGFDLLQSIKKVNAVKINRKHGEDISFIVKECVKKGIKTFMGDTRVSKVCQEMGCKCYLIRSGETSVMNALAKAEEILRILKDQIEDNKRYLALMDYVRDGVIATDENNTIVAYNRVAQGILGVEKNDFIGKKLDEVFFDNKGNALNYNDSPVYDVIKKVNDKSITLTQIPIGVLGEHKGSVSVFQDVKKLQKFEQKVRTQLLGKGFKAKYNFSDIIFESDAMKKSVDKAKKFSKYDSTILIQGSSGVGKELFAQSIHNFSNRNNGPFVAINCGALPESILESELFGYEEGAFTGSKKGGRAGVFEMAHKGTIFLDEIGEIPLNIQSQLLRVIQEREIMRLGDSKVIPLDIRIICATNKNLKKMVSEGKFREDLFYRINTLSFSIPMLKGRVEDIKLLSDFYMEKYRQKYEKQLDGFTQDALDFLNNSQFRGNVRELQNLIERAVVICDNNLISQQDLEDDNDSFSEEFLNEGIDEELLRSKLSLKAFESKYINYIFEKEGGSVKKVCDVLKIDRTTLWRKMKESQ
jgi:transcriptional regulator with PAS, ATPase and Fis domain